MQAENEPPPAGGANRGARTSAPKAAAEKWELPGSGPPPKRAPSFSDDAPAHPKRASTGDSAALAALRLLTWPEMGLSVHDVLHWVPAPNAREERPANARLMLADREAQVVRLQACVRWLEAKGGGGSGAARAVQTPADGTAAELVRVRAALADALEAGRAAAAAAAGSEAAAAEARAEVAQLKAAASEQAAVAEAELRAARERLGAITSEAASLVAEASAYRSAATDAASSARSAVAISEARAAEAEAAAASAAAAAAATAAAVAERDDALARAAAAEAAAEAAKAEREGAAAAAARAAAAEAVQEAAAAAAAVRGAAADAAAARAEAESLRSQLAAAVAAAEAAEAKATAACASAAASASAASDSDARAAACEAARRAMHAEVQKLRGAVRVAARVRPPLPALPATPSSPSASSPSATPHTVVSYPSDRELRGRGLVLTAPPVAVGAPRAERDRPPPPPHAFAFDAVFPHGATNGDVFSEVAPVVRAALDGGRACVFAYGATGSGKTHTLLGSHGGGGERGVAAMACELLFREAIPHGRDGAAPALAITASALEVYNEEVHDLLAPLSAQPPPSGWDRGGASGGCATVPPSPSLSIELTPSGDDATAAGSRCVALACMADVDALLATASAARATGATLLNARSSRSHMVITLRLGAGGGVLNLVDLAGSERLSKSGAEGDAAKETAAINKSLSALADVVAAIASKAAFVPFRNSKLTRLLSPALGPDARVLMLVTVSPEPGSLGETLCSLRFAAKAATCELAAAHKRGEIGGLLASSTAKSAAKK